MLLRVRAYIIIREWPPRRYSSNRGQPFYRQKKKKTVDIGNQTINTIPDVDFAKHAIMHFQLLNGFYVQYYQIIRTLVLYSDLHEYNI